MILSAWEKHQILITGILRNFGTYSSLMWCQNCEIELDQKDFDWQLKVYQKVVEFCLFIQHKMLSYFKVKNLQNYVNDQNDAFHKNLTFANAHFQWQILIISRDIQADLFQFSSNISRRSNFSEFVQNSQNCETLSLCKFLPLKYLSFDFLF